MFYMDYDVSILKFIWCIINEKIDDRENFIYPPKLFQFLQIFSNIQKLLFKYIKLCFSLTLLIPYKKSFAIPILPLTPKLHSQNDT